MVTKLDVVWEIKMEEGLFVIYILKWICILTKYCTALLTLI
jgi:hypothetical protein